MSQSQQFVEVLRKLPTAQVVRCLGFDAAPEDAKGGCDVLIECRVAVGRAGFKVEGYLHWDRHENKETSRSPRWRFIRLSDATCWTSHRGAGSVQKQADLSAEELGVFDDVRQKVKKALLQRKQELHKAGTLIDWGAERRWQDWISQLQDKRKSRALIRMREQIEEDRRNRAPCAAEWNPGSCTRRPGIVADQNINQAQRKRGCDAFQAYLSNLAREGCPKRQRRLREAPAAENSETELEVELSDVKLPAVSALLRDSAVATKEVTKEEAQRLWKLFEAKESSFGPEELMQLWRVAIAKVALGEDLANHCLLLADLQLQQRPKLSWVRLISVLQAVDPSDTSRASEYLALFARWLVRKGLPQGFGDNQGQLLDLAALADDVSKAHKALQGSGVAVAGGFGCFAGKRHGSQAALIPTFFTQEEQAHKLVVAMLVGASLSGKSPEVQKPVQALMQPGAAPCNLQFDLAALLGLGDEVPSLPADIRSNREENIGFLHTWQHLLRKNGPKQVMQRPFASPQTLKPLRGDPDMLQVLLCYGDEAELLLQLGPLEGDRVQPYLDAVQSGIIHLQKERKAQGSSECFWLGQDRLLKAVAKCAALVFARGADKQMRRAEDLFTHAAQIPRPGRWPQMQESREPKFNVFSGESFRELSGKPFTELINDPALHGRAKWMVLKFVQESAAQNSEVSRFAEWALRNAFSGPACLLLRLEMAPTSRKPLRAGTTVFEELRRMFAHASVICKSLLQPWLHLLQQHYPSWLRALAIRALLQSGLLALVCDEQCDGESLLGLLSSTRMSGHPLNQALSLAAQVQPAHLRDWVFACFARDLHILLLWMDVSRPLQEQAADAHVQALWSVGSLAARHLKGGWPPLPNCPDECRIVFNPFLSRCLPGSSDGLVAAWIRRPFSSALNLQGAQGAVPTTFAALAQTVEASSRPTEAEQESLGAFAEALSGSDCFDWVRLRRWRIDILHASGVLERRRLLAAIYSRLPAVHCVVAVRQQGRGHAQIAGRMLKEILIEATDFLQPAMDEYRAQAGIVTGEAEDAFPEVSESAKLWSARFLLYFCRALQLLRELPEGDAGDHVQSGLLMLEQFLRHCGCIGQDPDVARRLMKSTRKALTRAAASLEMAAENQQQGTQWEELAPPTTFADGCFRSHLGVVYEHSWSSIYAAIAETVS